MRASILILCAAATATAQTPWDGKPWESLNNRERRQRAAAIQRWQTERVDRETKLGPLMGSLLRGVPDGPIGVPPEQWHQPRRIIGSAGGWIGDDGKLNTVDASGRPVKVAVDRFGHVRRRHRGHSLRGGRRLGE